MGYNSSKSKTTHCFFFDLSDTLLRNRSIRANFMPTLKDFFEDLQNREGQQSRELIHSWSPELRDSIVSAFEKAVSDVDVKGSICPIKPRSTNQSAGNQVEKYIVPKLDSGLSGFSISKCRGSGYPDQILIQHTPRLQIPLEMKATSKWNEKDSNRRVITSSSKKLRRQFAAPIYHLLLTVLYSKQEEDDYAIIDTIRLDFIEPTTTVNIRLEASVNHKILVDGHHYSKTI